MQSTEKIACNNEGALQAQVDCHRDVPKVTPAAISAPTLSSISIYAVECGIASVLVEII